MQRRRQIGRIVIAVGTTIAIQTRIVHRTHAASDTRPVAIHLGRLVIHTDSGWPDTVTIH